MGNFFDSELLLAKIYCAMHECLVCSFLSMPSLNCPSLSLFVPFLCYLFFFHTIFFLCVWFGCSYIHLCAFWCVRVFFVWIWSAWLRWQLLLLHWAYHQKGSYQQVSPTPAQRLNGLRKLDVVPACCSLGALIQVRVSLRVQSPIFLSLMLLAHYLAHILSFREPRCDKPAATQPRWHFIFSLTRAITIISNISQMVAKWFLYS